MGLYEIILAAIAVICFTVLVAILIWKNRIGDVVKAAKEINKDIKNAKKGKGAEPNKDNRGKR